MLKIAPLNKMIYTFHNDTWESDMIISVLLIMWCNVSIYIGGKIFSSEWNFDTKVQSTVMISFHFISENLYFWQTDLEGHVFKTPKITYCGKFISYEYFEASLPEIASKVQKRKRKVNGYVETSIKIFLMPWLYTWIHLCSFIF